MNRKYENVHTDTEKLVKKIKRIEVLMLLLQIQTLPEFYGLPTGKTA